ncbi:glycosyltransferase family 2 protein [Phaeobacter sp.]|uniref:glycosyltransferase family 2 protein n=1 Tax=Phaeobacter sp. TaxID=1902409 RepID=UPI0025E6AAA9|nr:glycosyltransferase family 2 protein [Phaeobacter sp.]
MAETAPGQGRDQPKSDPFGRSTQRDGAHPLISVVVANHQGASFLDQALRSLAVQTHTNIEVIVSDDGSSDGSVAIVESWAQKDPRFKVLSHPVATGPAAARNRALACATGSWVAIFDSDDVMHPDRLKRLLRAAEALNADAAADDMIHFATEPLPRPQSVLGTSSSDQPRRIDVIDMLHVPTGAGASQLGYLKPLIRRSALQEHRYDETLTIGEDQDFYLRLLLEGVSLFTLPEALYLYRRHPGSLSHRSSSDQIAASLAAMEQLSEQLGDLEDAEIKEQIGVRRQILRRRFEFERFVEACKARQFGRALASIMFRPRLLLQAKDVLVQRLKRPQQNAVPRQRLLHLVGPQSIRPEKGDFVEVPGLDQDHGCSALWAELCFVASCDALTLTYDDASGLSAAWRVPAAVAIHEIGSLSCSLPRPGRASDLKTADHPVVAG